VDVLGMRNRPTRSLIGGSFSGGKGCVEYRGMGGEWGGGGSQRCRRLQVGRDQVESSIPSKGQAIS